MSSSHLHVQFLYDTLQYPHTYAQVLQTVFPSCLLTNMYVFFTCPSQSSCYSLLCPNIFSALHILKLSSNALVRKRTIPTERQSFVSEVSANFYGLEGVAWLAQRIPTAYSRLSRPEHFIFTQLQSRFLSFRVRAHVCAYIKQALGMYSCEF
jgi:hypothetical protein